AALRPRPLRIMQWLFHMSNVAVEGMAVNKNAGRGSLPRLRPFAHRVPISLEAGAARPTAPVPDNSLPSLLARVRWVCPVHRVTPTRLVRVFPRRNVIGYLEPLPLRLAVIRATRHQGGEPNRDKEREQLFHGRAILSECGVRSALSGPM